MKPVANEKPARQFARDPAVVSTLTPEQYRVTQQGATEMPGSATTWPASPVPGS